MIYALWTVLSVAFAHNHTAERCGTVHDEDELMRADKIARNFVTKVCANENLSDLRMCQPWEERVKQPVTIPVWYHIVHDGQTGRLTEQEVQAQFEQTNRDFAGLEDPSIPGWVKMDITFELAGTTYTDNAQWFSDMDRYEAQIKAAVAVDNTHNFNQYFGDLRGGLLGFCYFPNSFPESSFMHGCVNLFSSIPGGASAPYNEGKTTTHETGHGIGLFHTFQGGCTGAGDHVHDTCHQARATFGCPAIGPHSCHQHCRDPIHNYMDYSDDRCMTQFTPGQNDRANQQLSTFRPGLYLKDAEISLIETHLPGAWDEALAFSAKSEAAYMANRLSKGYSNQL